MVLHGYVRVLVSREVSDATNCEVSKSSSDARLHKPVGLKFSFSLSAYRSMLDVR